MKSQVESFFDVRSSTLTYVVYDPETKDALIIDPVLDYEPKASKAWTESVDVVIDFIKSNELKPLYILETHPHADHLSGSQMLKVAFPEIQLAIGDGIRAVQKTFKMVFDLPKDFPTDGSQFDCLIEDNEVLNIGSINVKAIPTPGHTPACMSFLIEDALFVGDLLFMPDSGSGRCDFPGGSAKDMYESVHRLYELADETLVFVGHDYQPGGREVKYLTTIGEQKRDNIALNAERAKQDFVTWRDARDQTLDAPQLIFQSMQVNVDAGALPEPNGHKRRFLKIPINVFRPPASEENPIEILDA